MKTFIIGDIHGCISPFLKLLDILAPDPAKDRLILLGDLFDRGPASWEVWQKVQLLARAFGDRFVLIRGNHEDYLLAPKLSFSERVVWERVGRGTTARSFKEHGSRMEECIPWMREHVQLFFRCEDEGFQCVHAGLKIDPPEANDTYTLVHDHSVVLCNLYAGPLTITGHIALDQPAWFAGDGVTVEILPRQVFAEAEEKATGVSMNLQQTGEPFSQPPAAEDGSDLSGTGRQEDRECVALKSQSVLKENGWRPLPKSGTICIDTGCGKGGMLTGMVIERGRYQLLGVA